ncbi:MAG: GTPase HflX [Elusimicrobia bacterium]|nr:GTPase HflX [Elusimicrobiota bacterium]
MAKALLVGTVSKGQKDNTVELLKELERLADTSGIKTIDSVVQKIEKPNPKFFIGEGKVFEIKKICEEKSVDAVIFDNELTATQQRNLEEHIPSRIIDRTRLILNIFAQRARTKVAQLQVELAEKQYELPRLSDKSTALAQQRGVIGIRAGFGERKIEVDRRKIKDRIAYLKKEIEKIKFHREIQRSKRQDVPLQIVSIVGYTNAGKSTFLNFLTGKNSVYADDKLFATLDPTTRKVKLPGGKFVLFTDTVGFIKKLPHQLIAAFKSTLEEITKSDLIIHLIDISDKNYKDNEKTVMGVLKEIGADKLTVINAYNKCDLLKLKPNHSENDFYLSAKTGAGVQELLSAISSKFESELKYKKISIPYNLFSLISKIKSAGKIVRYNPQKNDPKGYAELEILIDEKNWGQIQKLMSETNEKSYAS